MDRRAIECFDRAMHDPGLAAAGPLRQVLDDYFAWATTTEMARYHQSADEVPAGLVSRSGWERAPRMVTLCSVRCRGLVEWFVE
jgi:hemoglobin